MIVEIAEGFIHLFQSAGKIFSGMIVSTIPMLITLILTVNFIMKLIGQQRMEKVATLMGKSKILTYGILPSFAWFFLSSPGALTMGILSGCAGQHRTPADLSVPTHCAI